MSDQSNVGRSQVINNAARRQNSSMYSKSCCQTIELLQLELFLELPRTPKSCCQTAENFVVQQIVLPDCRTPRCIANRVAKRQNSSMYSKSCCQTVEKVNVQQFVLPNSRTSQCTAVCAVNSRQCRTCTAVSAGRQQNKSMYSSSCCHTVE